MASKYDELDATCELEQAVSADLTAALGPRGCHVTHHGTTTACAPGGGPDATVVDAARRRIILVEVTRRYGSAADGEFPAITEHLDRAVAAGGYSDYCCLYISPATSARMSANLLDRHNALRNREGKPGRIVALDFETFEELTTRLREADPRLYPAFRFGALFERWAEATDDARVRRLIAQVVFEEDHAYQAETEQNLRQRDALTEQRLRKAIQRLEDRLRESGVTGNSANIALIHLTFLRLYEEKKERETGKPNRFTVPSFIQWKEALPEKVKKEYAGRLAEYLLQEIATDPALASAGLLQRPAGQGGLKLRDKLVESLVLPLFDLYRFYGSSLDVLGVVFETLARRGEKDTRIGQFFTPQEVVNFCADLIDPSPRDVILDPAVGTARFLIAAMYKMLSRVGQLPGRRKDNEAAIKNRQILGVDLDDWVATIAKMNMYIHGDGMSHMVKGNGLVLMDRSVFDLYPDGIGGRIDVVLTNPPLGDTNYIVAREHWAALADDDPTPEQKSQYLQSLGVVPMRVPRRQRDEPDIELPLEPTAERRKGGAIFLGAIAKYLKKNRSPDAEIEWQGGQAAVVVDEAILNTPDYADVRAFIRREFFVKAVISLGRPAFKYLAHTDAKTSVLYVVRKSSVELVQREPIFYAHAERVGYSSTGKWIGSDLPGVLAVYNGVRDAIRGCYHRHRFDTDDCLSVLSSRPGFSDTWHVRAPGDEPASRMDFFNARYHDIVKNLRTSGVQLTELRDLIAPRTANHPLPSTSDTYEFATIDRTTATLRSKGVQQVSYRPCDLWVVNKRDIVVSGIDLVHGSVAVADASMDGLVMSKEMFPYVVRRGTGVLPEYMALLLRTDLAKTLIHGWITGTSNRTRLSDADQLLAIPVPAPPPLSEQRKIVRGFKLAAGHRTTADAESAKSAASVAGVWRIHLSSLYLDDSEGEAPTDPATAQA